MLRNWPRSRAVDVGLERFRPWLVSAASSAHQSAKFQPRAAAIDFINACPLPLPPIPVSAPSTPPIDADALPITACAPARVMSSAPCTTLLSGDAGPSAIRRFRVGATAAMSPPSGPPSNGNSARIFAASWPASGQFTSIARPFG